MSILENISLWGGVAGVVTAVFAIIIIYLTRHNIIELLDKDVILYEKVYELKKNAFTQAFDVLDLYEIYGMDIKTTKQFVQKAKSAYNDLMCAANNSKIYEDFYMLTLNPNTTTVSVYDVAAFKAMCREDLGLHTKKLPKKASSQSVKAVVNNTAPNQAKPIATPKQMSSNNASSQGVVPSNVQAQPSRPVVRRPVVNNEPKTPSEK